MAFAASSVISIVLLVPLIRGWGVVGAAAAFALGHALSTTLVIARAWRGARGTGTVEPVP
jgi:Na+-driven multidrug efflux pump